MNKKMIYTLAAFLIPLSLIAGASAETNSIGSRAATLQEYVAQQETRAMAAEEEEGPKPTVRGYKTTHNDVYHRPCWVSPLGDQVELENGTLWAVSYSDRKKTFDWYTSDTIIITPNNSWFSSYHYRLRNLATNQNVKANIMDVPLNSVLNTHWIAQIDPDNKEICLEDGSVWKVAGWDKSVIKKWVANDRIVIGCNDGWFSGSNPNILVNLETLNYAASECTR